MSVRIKMAMPENCYECRFCETYLGHHLCVAFLNYIEDPRSGRLDTCPLEEVQEPKRGKWVDGHYSGFDGCRVWHRECSVCGHERDDDDPDKDTNFCPNCGARMESE